MKFSKTLLTTALLSATTLSASAMAFEADKTYKFTVLHVNDTHGHFWKNDKNEYGFAAQKKLQLIKYVKKSKPTAVRLYYYTQGISTQACLNPICSMLNPILKV